MKTQNRFQFPAISLAILLVFVVISCEVDKDENKPVVATNEVTAINSTEALCGGVISSDGGFAVTTRGVCWSTDPNPTIDDNKTTDGAGAGSFTSQITSLQPKTNYYVRAYAINSEGTGYGMAMAFETIGAAVLTTAEVTEISYTSAVCGGTIASDGDQSITARGVCWSTSPDSVELGNASGFTVNGSGIGSFESELPDLSLGTTYYIRAYATNSIETFYGDIKSFKTLGPTGTFKDSRDGQVYNYMAIGNQTWMAENLKFLPTVHNNAEFESKGNNSQPGYGIYGYNGSDVATANLLANYTTYGVLYNWFAVNSGDICPSGWHIATDAEWAELTDFLGGSSLAGGKLKETGTSHWNGSNTGATNETGFTALPGGLRVFINEVFHYIGDYGVWWCAAENSIWGWAMNYDDSGVSRGSYDKRFGLSVRCVKD